MSARPPRPPTRPALDLVPIHGNRGLHDSFFCLFFPACPFADSTFFFSTLDLGSVSSSRLFLRDARSRSGRVEVVETVPGVSGVGGEDLSSPVCPPGLPAVASSRACRKSSAQQVIDIIENNNQAFVPLRSSITSRSGSCRRLLSIPLHGSQESRRGGVFHLEFPPQVHLPPRGGVWPAGRDAAFPFNLEF